MSPTRRDQAPGADLPTSAGHLLQLVRRGRVHTRKELIELTGLSRSTVASRVDALLAAGYLEEGGQATSSGGRPPSTLAFSAASKTLLVADLGATHGRVAVVDAAGTTIAETTLESSIADGPEAVLSRVSTAFTAMLAVAARIPEQVSGIGVSVPGPVDFATARVVQPPIMKGWHDYPIRDFLHGSFDAPVYVDNDADVMALGEQHLSFPDAASLLFVKVATGIGAGIVIDGKVYRGVDGAAGGIGHVRLLQEGGNRCACGSVGCLAAHASGAAVAAQLRREGRRARNSRDVVRLVHQGDAPAIRLVRAAGQALGEVLATAVSLLNPQLLVIGGDMALTHEHFLLGVREALYTRTLPLATRSLGVVQSPLGDRAGVAGTAVMVLEEVFSAEAVDIRLSEASAGTPATRG